MNCIITITLIATLFRFLSCSPEEFDYEKGTRYNYAESDYIVTDYNIANDFPESLKVDLELQMKPLSIKGDVYAANFENVLHLINFKTKEKQPIKNAILGQTTRSVCLTDLYMAWIDGKDIKILDRESEQVRTLKSHKGQPIQLALDGKRIVWAEVWQESGLMRGNFRIKNSDIYAYDLETEQEYTISVASGIQSNPSIHGDLIVWQDNRDSPYKSTIHEGCSNCPKNRFDIYLFDFKTSSSRVIANNKWLKSFPIVNRQRIVWEEYQGREKTGYTRNQADLFMFDIPSAKLTRLTKTPDPETRPILIGDSLLWRVRTASDVITLGPNGKEIKPDTGIYILNLTSGLLKRLSNFKEPRVLFDGHRAIIIEWGFSRSGRMYALELK